MDHRPILQKTLESVKGVKKVYFDPPSNIKMVYPCIRFSLADRDAHYADNRKYLKREAFTIIFITLDPVSATDVLDQLEEITLMRFDRSYVADGLHHYVYTKTY